MKKNDVRFRKIDGLILSLIIVVGLIFRLYKYNTPLADLHSWRQVDTAAVARNFVKDGFDLLHPRYDDISASSTGFENPQGYRFVEFPLYNATFALLYKMLPIFSLEVWGRLTSVIFSLFIIAVIYYLTLKEANRATAIIASVTYAVFPYFVFFSRTVLPETMALSLSFISIFFLYLSFNTVKKLNYFLFFVLSLLFFSLSLLIKPTVIFFSIVLFFMFINKYKFSIIKRFEMVIFFGLAVLPLFLWRNYIKAYPQAVPPNEWLIYKVNTFEGQKTIFMKPAFFRWIFFERINNLILGGYLTFLFILGIFSKPKSFLFHSLLVASMTYLLVFQGGNVQHEYYQILILPAVAIFIALGVYFLTKNSKNIISPVIAYPIVLIIFLMSFAFSYYKVKDFYIYPDDLPQIAKIVSALTQEDDKIVTERSGDTTLLYLTGRKGAPGIYKNVDEYGKEGYKYLVTTTMETVTKLKKEGYQVVFENDKFAMFKL